MSIDPERIPEPARTAWLRLRDELLAILADDLAAMWAHGGTLASTQPRAADLDTYVILARRPHASTAQAIEDAQQAIERDLGVEWDSWYITAEQAHRAEAPTHAFREGRRDTSWAIHRAHWMAGRYALLHGAEPAATVSPPTWRAIEAELDRELEHLEAHVADGDTDPYEATYAVLNGSRILHALERREVAVSKPEAGAWALEHLAGRWHPVLAAAVRNHDGQATEEDVVRLAGDMAPFVAMVRERLPAAGTRAPDDAPRFSGF